MYNPGVAFLALVGAAFAANGTVQIWLPQNNEPNLIGSVVGSDTTATTYSVACVTEDCSFPTSFLVTEGPSSVEWTFTYALYNTDIPVTQKLNCQITDSSSGACTVTASYNPSSSPFSTTLITSFASPSDADIFLINTIVTITAGSVASSTSTAASTTRSGSGAMVSSPLSATGSSTKSAASVTGSSSSSGSSSSTSVSSAKGAPMITQAPLLLGAAAAIVYAAL
ncbi:hypothetical protein IFR04_011686 [Cadophora malorum]|uniref:GPI anchored cell wall protein n=1 Tax=Cadophora malorum TaxID=108018 RepID=A0A8H7TAE9_9HELO|nr:hypothetical protein IFR04_011686 [Cadophora malorum]